MTPQWKRIAATVCGTLGSADAAVVGLDGRLAELDGRAVMNLSDGAERVGTTVPSIRRLSQWLWEQRQKRAMRRSHGVVWAARVNGDVVLGLGALIPQAVARRARPNSILTPLESGAGSLASPAPTM